MDEPEWLEAARAYLDAHTRGDTAKAHATYTKLAPLVRQRVRRLCERDASLLRAGRTSADDIEQHVLLKLLTHPPAAPEKLVSWCYQVARNAARDAARRRDNRAAAIPVEWEASTERQPVDRSLLQALADCVAALEGRYAATWEHISQDPKLAAIDLALALGLITPELVREHDSLRRVESEKPATDVANESELERREDVNDRVKKALQNAWAARSHTLKKLQRCLRECGFDSLPEGEWV